MTHTNPIYCAVDTTDLDDARTLAGTLKGAVGGLKLGLEFFTAHGPAGYRAIAEAGLPVFLDLKLHDIPNTVAGAMRSVTCLQPAIATIHAAGGSAMMRAARDAAGEEAAKRGIEAPKIVAVTVLTSLDGDDLKSIGVASQVQDQVRRLAELAAAAGLDGVVCAPHEIETVRSVCGPDFVLVVPGIRPEGSAKGDQKRAMTPAEAQERGANVLVIGRPITQSPDPAEAARSIAATLRLPI